MNTTPKLATSVRISESSATPKKKFRIRWLNLLCQIAGGVALAIFIIALIEGYSL